MAYKGKTAWGNLAPSLQEKLDGMGSKTNAIPYTLETTEVAQKSWNLPQDSYDVNKDSMIVFHNTIFLNPTSWSLTGDAGSGYILNIPENPHEAIEDNNVVAVIFRGMPTNVGDSISGTLLTPESISLDKLGQDVQDKISKASEGVIISPVSPEGSPTAYPMGFSMFNVQSSHDVWLFYFGIEEIDQMVYTNLQVRTYRIGNDAIQELIVLDGAGVVNYISQRISVSSIFQSIHKARIIYGVPSVQIVNDLTTGGATKVASAETVKTLKTELDNSVAPKYGVERINDNHAIRRFPVFNDWVSNVNSESLMIRFPNVPFVGEVRLRLTGGDLSNPLGSSESIYHLSRPLVDGAIAFSFYNVTSSEEFLKMFRPPQGAGSNSTYDWKPYITLIKKSKKIPLYIELEFTSNIGIAGDILDNTVLYLMSTSSNPDTAPAPIMALDKAMNAVTELTTSRSYYVNPTTGDNSTGAPNDTSKKYKTIQRVIDSIPKMLHGNITIYLDAGSYPEDININSFTGYGSITIRGASTTDLANATQYAVSSFNIKGCTVGITLLGISMNTSSYYGVWGERCSYLLVQNCSLLGANNVYAGILVDKSRAYITGCNVSNRGIAIHSINVSTAFVQSVSGTTNTTSLNATHGATIIKSSNTISGVETTSVAGVIR